MEMCFYDHLRYCCFTWDDYIYADYCHTWQSPTIYYSCRYWYRCLVTVYLQPLFNRQNIKIPIQYTRFGLSPIKSYHWKPSRLSQLFASSITAAPAAILQLWVLQVMIGFGYVYSTGNVPFTTSPTGAARSSVNHLLSLHSSGICTDQSEKVAENSVKSEPMTMVSVL